MKRMGDLEALASGMNEEIKRQNIILAAYAEEIKRLRAIIKAYEDHAVADNRGAIVEAMSALNQKE
jgi:hypothetical protein